MHSFVLDIRFAIRNLLKNPGFTSVAVLTLALGIGANTALFGVVESVVLRPLPFEDPDELVSIWEYSPDDTGRMHKSRATAGNYADWRDQSNAFDDMAIFGASGFNWTGRGEPEQLLGARVSASYFSVLGIEPVVGRAFVPEENEPGNHRVILLGHGLWQRRFGAATDVVGQILTLDGAPYEVVGVMPPGVYPTWPQATGRMRLLPVYQQYWVPMALSEERRSDRGSHVYGVVGRLREHIDLDEARAEMDTIARRLEEAYPRFNEGERTLVVPYMDEVVGGVRPALFVLLGAVGLVLLIACANIASLLLARGAARGREVAVRAALGAGRARILRQLLSESLLLALAGGALGIGVAWLGVRALVRLSPEQVPRLEESGLSLAVLGFALFVSAATGVLFGLVPALQLSRPELGSSLKEGARTTGDSARFGLRRTLVVAEISMAVVLVIGAGLLIQSFWRLRQIDLGFRAENVLIAELALPSSKYDEWREITEFYETLLERLRRFPEVRDAAIAYDHPLDSSWSDAFRFIGSTESEESFAATFRIVSADYFRTFGIDVVRGRAFTELDDPEHPGAVIVNEAFVRRYLPDADPLGHRLYTSTPRAIWGEPIPDTFEIVGVVRNVKFLGPRAEDEPAFYVPSRQAPQWGMLVTARTESDPITLTSRLREEVRALDPELPLSSVTTMERHLAEALAQPRFTMLLLGLFGAAALFLAAMGIYGLLAYSVAQRTNEIGLRMALGAQAKDVTRLIVGQGLALTAVGLGVGLVGALALSRVLSGLVFGVSAKDPATFVVVTSFLGLVAVVASYVPALRATRIHPIRALRHE